MARSKRQRVVTLAKTSKHVLGQDVKAKLITQIQEYVDEYENIYVFSYGNLRNNKLKEIRVSWSDSRFYLGRNTLIQKAFGTSPENEYKKDLCELSQWLSGKIGVLFTNRSHDDVAEFFSEYEAKDFARSGFEATETIRMPKGPLEDFDTSQEPKLRQLGLPCAVKNGKVVLLSEYLVCEAGEKLSPEKAKILELVGIQMATFEIQLIARWNAEVGVQTIQDD